jgi:hypothetical protein
VQKTRYERTLSTTCRFVQLQRGMGRRAAPLVVSRHANRRRIVPAAGPAVGDNTLHRGFFNGLGEGQMNGHVHADFGRSSAVAAWCARSSRACCDAATWRQTRRCRRSKRHSLPRGFREMRGHGKAASAEGGCHAGRPVVKLTGSPIPRSGHPRERKKLPPLTEITVLNAALSGEAPD